MPGGAPQRVYHVEPVGFFPIKKVWAPNRSVAWIYLFIRRNGEPLFGITSGIQYSISRSIDDLNTKESNEILTKAHDLDAEAYITVLSRLNSASLLSLGEIDSPRVSFKKSFYTGSDLRLNVYRLNDASPRAYFVPNVHWVDSHPKALEQLLNPKFPYRNTVILEGAGKPENSSDGSGKARFLNYESDYVRCEVESRSEGYLVLLDSYYPDWRATLDGTPVPILRANYAFRAVKIPAGKHQVEFRYRPRSFYLGLLVTGLTLILGIGICFFPHSRKQISAS